MIMENLHLQAHIALVVILALAAIVLLVYMHYYDK